jgi:hypothetical protein
MNQIENNQDLRINEVKIVGGINETLTAPKEKREKHEISIPRTPLLEAFYQEGILRRQRRFWTPQREMAAIIHLTNFQQFMIKKGKEPFIENVNAELCIAFVHQFVEKGLTNDQIIRKITFMINTFATMRKEIGGHVTKDLITCFNHFQRNYYIKGE